MNLSLVHHFTKLLNSDTGLVSLLVWSTGR